MCVCLCVYVSGLCVCLCVYVSGLGQERVASGMSQSSEMTRRQTRQAGNHVVLVGDEPTRCLAQPPHVTWIPRSVLAHATAPLRAVYQVFSAYLCGWVGGWVGEWM